MEDSLRNFIDEQYVNENHLIPFQVSSIGKAKYEELEEKYNNSTQYELDNDLKKALYRFSESLSHRLELSIDDIVDWLQVKHQFDENETNPELKNCFQKPQFAIRWALILINETIRGIGTLITIQETLKRIFLSEIKTTHFIALVDRLWNETKVNKGDVWMNKNKLISHEQEKFQVFEWFKISAMMESGVVDSHFYLPFSRTDQLVKNLPDKIKVKFEHSDKRLDLVDWCGMVAQSCQMNYSTVFNVRTAYEANQGLDLDYDSTPVLPHLIGTVHSAAKDVLASFCNTEYDNTEKVLKRCRSKETTNILLIRLISIRHAITKSNNSNSASNRDVKQLMSLEYNQTMKTIQSFL